LDFTAVHEILSAKKHPLYEAALEDCGGDKEQTEKYLASVERTAADYVRRKDKVWDREELIERLEKCCLSEGEFVCLLGGKSTGKSLLIDYVAKKSSSYVIDLRGNADILENLTEVLRSLPREAAFELTKNYLTKGKLVVSSKTIYALYNTLPTSIFQTLIKAVFGTDIGILSLREKEKEYTLEKLIELLIASSPEIVTIFIDEANRAFNINPDSIDRDIVAKKAVDALELFTKLAKQKLKVHALH